MVIPFIGIAVSLDYDRARGFFPIRNSNLRAAYSIDNDSTQRRTTCYQIDVFLHAALKPFLNQLNSG
ncbi:hypothetical protein A9Q89_03670 [Gammaproteobacteria bacterium 53_120_T64]|nr:hypothetical protein A9Q89_03670 [Gammaproteobacteria bacterium 53_120_T64]